MAGPAEPLTYTSIRHPLQQQLLFHLKEIPTVFLDQLDRLYFSLQVAQAKCSSPEAIQILQQARTLAGEKVYVLIKMVVCCAEFASSYIQLLKSLKMRQNHRSALSSVRVGATVGVEETNKSTKAMDEFREELGDAVNRITTVMKANRKRHTNLPLFATENIQAISEIYSAIDECNGVLQGCRGYFVEARKQASDRDLFLTDPPSEREIQVMLEKWGVFYEVTRSDDLMDGWTAMRQSIQTFPDRSRVLPVSVAVITPPQPSPTNESNLPIWLRLFRRPARNQSKNANNDLGGWCSSTTTNATSPDGSAKSSSRRKFSWRPDAF